MKKMLVMMALVAVAGTQYAKANNVDNEEYRILVRVNCANDPVCHDLLVQNGTLAKKIALVSDQMTRLSEQCSWNPIVRSRITSCSQVIPYYDVRMKIYTSDYQALRSNLINVKAKLKNINYLLENYSL